MKKKVDIFLLHYILHDNILQYKIHLPGIVKLLSAQIEGVVIGITDGDTFTLLIKDTINLKGKNIRN